MADTLQLRGGTTSQNSSFTGSDREVTVDTTKKTLIVHDGSVAGGFPLMKESGGNAASSVGIGTGGTNAINIDSSQKVGIGTASPARSLDVNGSMRLANDQVVEWGGTSTAVYGSSSSNGIFFKTNFLLFPYFNNLLIFINFKFLKLKVHSLIDNKFALK